MKKVWFIRHAESEANAGLPSSDPSLIPLTQKGMQQAQALSEQLTEPAGLFIMSPYIRTQQTARPILERFPDVITEIWPIHEFDFLSPFKCAGTTVEQRKPMVDDYWEQCQPDYVHGEGAESFLTFISRVISSIKRIEASPYDFVIVFTHGHFIRAAWQYSLNEHAVIGDQHMRNYRDLMITFPVANTAIFKAGFDGYNWQTQEPLISTWDLI